MEVAFSKFSIMHSNNGILAEARGTLCVGRTECLANVGRIVTVSVNHEF